jgi:uncharacterized protein YndB with AHSA1/START domain
MSANKAGKTTWAGRVLTFLILPPFLGGIVMMLTKNPQALEGMAKLGWPASAAPTILTLEIVCLALYLIPATSVLGAVLLTGYLGGAVATHLRAGESPAMAVAVGALVWAGIYLRERRLWELLPLRLAPGSEFRIERSASIAAPPDKVFALIDDLRAWSVWSPWEKMDPALKKTYGGPRGGKGATYAWEGNKQVGSGRMEIAESSSPTRIVIALDFIKPFEAHNVAEFALAAKDGVTSVTWSMRGPSPFFWKVMGLFVDMDKMIGKNFEAGLADMKAAAEKR